MRAPFKIMTWYVSDPVAFIFSQRMPLVQQFSAFAIAMPGTPELVKSTVRSSMPEFLITVLPHQAPGLCELRQFGMCRPGEIVTLLPLMAVTVTTCTWSRPDRA